MTSSTIEHAMQALANADPDIARALPLSRRAQPAPARSRLCDLLLDHRQPADLYRAARAIMGRVNTLLPELHAKAVMEVEGQALRDAGLSWRKIEYAKGLAEAELAGTFSADGLAHLSDDEAIAAITQLRGFGRWSAEIYLMFSLQRPDIFPADDLALRVALGRLKGMENKPTPKQARQMVEHWAPWRSVGSLFLWHYYRGEPV